MVLQDYKIEGDYIRISKKELEAFRDHYCDVISQHRKNKDSFRQAFYTGKRDVCIELLKMFEPLMG